ncbi:hypothetical protein DXB20_26425 [Escherichia coli]|uniref:phage holin n=1 Tax=Escherichia coli TaxID=562 RepID=UPI000E431BC5|nr:hypothetical protein DXB20_26425 [Escherichia coli]
MSRKLHYGLSVAVLALIATGASAPEILDQFLDEKEGKSLCLGFLTYLTNLYFKIKEDRRKAARGE